MANVMISETFINHSKGYCIGDTDPYEPYHSDNIGKLFRELSREYGRCISSVYLDGADGTPIKIGWVFQSRQQYEDAHWYGECPNRASHLDNCTYIREVWVTLHDAPDTVTREHHYHKL